MWLNARIVAIDGHGRCLKAALGNCCVLDEFLVVIARDVHRTCLFITVPQRSPLNNKRLFRQDSEEAEVGRLGPQGPQPVQNSGRLAEHLVASKHMLLAVFLCDPTTGPAPLC